MSTRSGRRRRTRCWCGSPATEQRTRAGCLLLPGESASEVTAEMVDREWLTIQVPVCEAHRDAERWPEWVHGVVDRELRQRGVVMTRRAVEELVAGMWAGEIEATWHETLVPRIH